MKHFSTTIIIAVVLAMVWSLWFFNQEHLEKQQLAKTQARTPVDLDANDLTRLTVLYKTDEPVVCERDDDNQWQIVAPIVTQTESFAINSLVSAVVGIRSEQPPWQPETADLTEWGLATPEVTLTFESGGIHDPITLMVGDTTALNRCFVKRADQDLIWVLPAGVKTGTVKDLYALREKNVVSMPYDLVQRIEFKTPPLSLSAKRLGQHEWLMTAPVRGRLDAEKTRAIINQFDTLRAKKFYDAPTEDQLSEWGVSAQPEELSGTNYFTAHLQDGQTRTLLIGERMIEESAFYARVSDSSTVVLIEDTVYDPFPGQVWELRPEQLMDLQIHSMQIFAVTRHNELWYQMSKGIMGSWMVESPVSATAEYNQTYPIFSALTEARVFEYLLSPEPLAELGLDPPQLVLHIAADPTTASVSPVTVLFGNPREEDQRVFAQWENYDDVFVVEQDVYHALTEQIEKLLSALTLDEPEAVDEPEANTE